MQTARQQENIKVKRASGNLRNRVLLILLTTALTVIVSVSPAKAQSTAKIKGMVYYSGMNSGRIVSCFNSTLSGAAATTPPCGFSASKRGTGNYVFDFGFRIDNRFYSLSNTNWFATSGLCTEWNGACSTDPGLTTNQVEVFTFMPSPYNTYADTKFYLTVY
jgi:hypothetical protein